MHVLDHLYAMSPPRKSKEADLTVEATLPPHADKGWANTVFYCGAPTLKGGLCRNVVPTESGWCVQHRNSQLGKHICICRYCRVSLKDLLLRNANITCGDLWNSLNPDTCNKHKK